MSKYTKKTFNQIQVLGHLSGVFKFMTNYFMKMIEKSVLYRVKSGNLEHQVNSDIRLNTVEIRIFIVCLVNLFFHSSN